MADIAAIFHWAPRDMDPMSPGELARWWGLALDRTPDQGNEDDG